MSKRHPKLSSSGTSIDAERIEGLSVFLSVFDLPDVAATFCPPKPAMEQAGSPANPPSPPCSPAGVARRLPPLDQVIDEGKVLALNMPAGIDQGWETNLAERDIHPAPAEMNLIQATAYQIETGPPRAREDEPAVRRCVVDGHRATPRARG